MTREDIMTMDASNLFVAVGEMLEAKFDAENELTGHQITIYTLWLFDLEVQNGGLSQFFTNSSGEMAAFVPSALLAVEADEYEALLAHFLDETGLDLETLEGCEDEQHNAAYGEFDDRYYTLYETQPLDELAAAYIRAHADMFGAEG